MKRGALEQWLARTTDDQSDLDVLEERELEVFSLFAQQLPPHIICDELGLSREQLRQETRRIERKLRLRDTDELIRVATRHVSDD